MQLINLQGVVEQAGGAYIIKLSDLAFVLLISALRCLAPGMLEVEEPIHSCTVCVRKGNRGLRLFAADFLCLVITIRAMCGFKPQRLTEIGYSALRSIRKAAKTFCDDGIDCHTPFASLYLSTSEQSSWALSTQTSP